MTCVVKDIDSSEYPIGVESVLIDIAQTVGADSVFYYDDPDRKGMICARFKFEGPEYCGSKIVTRSGIDPAVLLVDSKYVEFLSATMLRADPVAQHWLVK